MTGPRFVASYFNFAIFATHLLKFVLIFRSKSHICRKDLRSPSGLRQ
jgi:hypothetical protein